MPNINLTKFKLTNNIANSTVTPRLEQSLSYYLNWAFLEMGAFSNVLNPSVNIYSGNRHVLTSIDTNRLSYEAFRKDWVYETGLTFGTVPLTPVIKVNGVIVSTGFTIDYRLGRINFSVPKAASDSITAQFSYKNIQNVISGDAPWWQEIQFDSFKNDENTFTEKNSGDWLINGKYRVQLPVIIIETSPIYESEGYELGNGALKIRIPVLLHIVSDVKTLRDKISDTLLNQKDKIFSILNIDSIAQNNDWPLNLNGSKNSGGLMYPALIDTYEFNKAWIYESNVSELEMPNPQLFAGTVRWNIEIIVGSI